MGKAAGRAGAGGYVDEGWAAGGQSLWAGGGQAQPVHGPSIRVVHGPSEASQPVAAGHRPHIHGPGVQRGQRPLWARAKPAAAAAGGHGFA